MKALLDIMTAANDPKVMDTFRQAMAALAMIPQLQLDLRTVLDNQLSHEMLLREVLMHVQAGSREVY